MDKRLYSLARSARLTNPFLRKWATMLARKGSADMVDTSQIRTMCLRALVTATLSRRLSLQKPTCNP